MGAGVVLQLAKHLAHELPDIKGFTRPNLFRMKQLYETYRGNEKVSPLLRQLPWTHNLLILGKCKSEEEREFYIHLTIHEKYSSRELERQIDGAFFERTISAVLRQLQPDVMEIFKDAYLLDFLNLPDSHSERDLQKALITNLKKFILELGRDFSSVGEEYRLQVGNNDFSIDLLFYHRELQCLVAFDLKIDGFKPVLLCKSRDAEVVEYALSRTLSPALVAEYQLRLPDKALLQHKLHEFYELQRAREDQHT
jgi:predicted nuclease of restriction endonuclease-like (RecB) superfamily